MRERKAVIKYISHLLRQSSEHEYTKGYHFTGALRSDLDKLRELEKAESTGKKYDCSGCKGQFKASELFLHDDGVYCQSCSYELEAKLDNMTGGE